MSTAFLSAAASALASHTPRATYRLQLRADFGLADVRDLLNYLNRLGVSDVYLSPIFRARQGSSHGYDVVDHGMIEPSFGDLTDFQHLAVAARDLGMGVLLDVAPNHMGINDSGNAWWLDVLEHGEASPFADHFDIDWRPAALDLQHKVLLPFLGTPFGEALESGRLRIAYDRSRFKLHYGDQWYPLTPSSWPLVLDVAAHKWEQHADAEASNDGLIELRSIAELLRGASASAVRTHSAADLEERLRLLVDQLPAASGALEAALAEFNGEPGDAKSFDALEQLLAAQHYRLAYWRVAADEINYRRFFDINDLAAIRVEEPRVFDAVHRLVGELLARNWATGLRIDHPDGLFDPQEYFDALQSLYRAGRLDGEESDAVPLYVVAEKILSGDESLPHEWAVCGTTGYDVLNFLNRLQVHSEGLAELRSAYPRLTGQVASPTDVLYESKRAILDDSMASELQMVASQLYAISRRSRTSRDFTFAALRRGLREIIACLGVYRTYLRPKGWEASEADYRHVSQAVRLAKLRNRAAGHAVFDFIASVLLLQNPPTLSTEQADERRRFVLKVQQVTGPVAAKGLEDTAFYRYFPLASLNEVGGELEARPLVPDELHRLMERRQADWPLSLSATSTHDTKRGEDLRARLNVLSELSSRWAETADRWIKLSQPKTQEIDGEQAPDPNTQYLIYQTLVGTWPEARRLTDGYAHRLSEYATKALREAKLRTSWASPSEPYEQAVTEFIHWLLRDDATKPFRAELRQLVEDIAKAGYVNGLAQTLLKITLPGVPDFYQGTELWDFHLVDPDNRRPVDFARCRELLAGLERGFAENPRRLAQRLSQGWPSPELKLYVIWRALQARLEFAEAFTGGEYRPLAVRGALREHLFAFARHSGPQRVVVVAPRHVQCFATAGPEEAPTRPLLDVDWQDTTIVLPEAAGWRNEFTTQAVMSQEDPSGESLLPAGDAFDCFPVTLLTARDA